jgi:nitrite reductase (NADH) large subunit
MPRQLDTMGAALLKTKIESLGISVHTGASTKEITGTTPDADSPVKGMAMADGTTLDVDMVIVSAGIRPRDELARTAGIAVGERGGIVVDSHLKTSDDAIYCIGEAALVSGMIYGLVAPGYEMADITAQNILGEQKHFLGFDMSTKLKLIGVDVGSFGDAFGEAAGSREVSYINHKEGIYKKLVVSGDGKRLLGGILVGDTNEYGQLHFFMENGTALPEETEALLFSGKSGGMPEVEIPDSAIICKCNAVCKGDLAKAIEGGACTPSALKKATTAGTGCGGCMQSVGDVLKAELKKKGQVVSQNLCEHFAMPRKDLYTIIKVKKLATFGEVIRAAGKGLGCEICKPAVASMLASAHSDTAAKHATIQDTNDRFLANIQRGGTYSIVPRVPGGEILPDKLIALGMIAKKYDLYCKITGGQRIDLFGARVDQLPEIWEELIDAGFESGHAYAKALRTVKSCVGSTWCRFGVQDSTSMAIRVEERYRGLRAPHKIKAAVSGCIRECAEAQSKDFGLIATEKGWNLYLAGNGGVTPQHAVLFASDIDADTAIKYIDRFLMYYIRTADRLERTAWWLNNLEGGIEHLKQVIIEDSLGICADLEAEMEAHVNNYKCEWKEVVENPELRRRFRHLVNAPVDADAPAFIRERGQKRPPDWDINPEQKLVQEVAV